MTRRKMPENAAPGKNDLLALALAQGLTQVEAGSRAGVSERTVRARMADPDFVARVHSIRDRMVSEAVGKLAATAAKAADRLGALLDDEDPNVRLRAAKAIIESTVRLATFHDLAERLSTVEAKIANRANTPPRPRLAIPNHDPR